MQITAVRVLQLTGGRAHDEPLWVERHGGPLSVYPEFRALPPGPASDGGRATPTDGGETTATFLRVDTDEGVSGIASVSGGSARIIATELRPLLLGRDPLATERLWDIAYRAMIHGRKGAPMMALSSVDNALWDLKGRWLGQPVYRLLGGPTRETIRCYASALGHSKDPQRAAESARRLTGQGFRAVKWFLKHGPASGPEGLRLNVALVRALRDAIGGEVDLMLDAWSGWDLPYAVQVGRRIAEYGIRWLEEPVMPDKIAAYAQVRRALAPLGIPISGGEHEYTRWGHKLLMDAGAVDVLQPDAYWAGGLSEVRKICALASTYDLPVVPHGHSVQVTAHLLAATPPDLCPLLEYMTPHQLRTQHFLEHPLHPERGEIAVSRLTQPGLGMALDEQKIVRQRELSFD